MKKIILQFGSIFKGLRLLVLMFFIVSAVSYVVQSCSRNENYEYSENYKTNEQLRLFKNTLIKEGKEARERKATNRGDNVSETEFIAFEEGIRPDALTLIRAYGITDEEIIEAFGSLDSPKISVAAEAILITEDLIDNGQTLTIFEDSDYRYSSLGIFGVNSVYAQKSQDVEATDTIGGCIADAIGITAAFEVIEKGVAGLGKKGVLKIIRKIGGKYLGAIGAALAAYDFADCMGWI